MTTHSGNQNDAAVTESKLPGIDFEAGRRAFIRNISVGAAGAALLGATGGPALAQSAVTDGDVLNLLLNLEYLEAEFYVRAAFGQGLADSDTGGGTGTLGPVTGGTKVPFTNPLVSKYAQEIAIHERAHVQFLRAVLGAGKVNRPAINFPDAFSAAARAAGLVNPTNGTFDAFANDANFLLGAFIFEDVGVTGYKGAAGLIQGAGARDAIVGICAIEAYHASLVRTVLYSLGQYAAVQAISDARDSLDNTSDAIMADDDKGIGDVNSSTIVPCDAAAIAFTRTPRQVLNIVYLNGTGTATSGGFFPAGVNGLVH